MNNIYVGGFPYKTTKEDLEKLFSTCGTVVHAKVILERETGRPRGFGFVEMSSPAEAKLAVEKLNGALMGDRKIFAVVGRKGAERSGPPKKPSAASPAPGAPGFVERRSGKDRRKSEAPPEAGRRSPAPSPSAPKPPERKPFERKPWGKKPFEGKPSDKKPFERAPADKKPFERKPPVRGPVWRPKKD